MPARPPSLPSRPHDFTSPFPIAFALPFLSQSLSVYRWESCSRIDKDVGRTDRAHPVFATEGCAAAKALRRVLLSYITHHPAAATAAPPSVAKGGAARRQAQRRAAAGKGGAAAAAAAAAAAEPRCYCQGMSDLAAPLLVVLADESEAFAAFEALMARVGGNFDADQGAVHAQLGALQRLIQVRAFCWHRGRLWRRSSRPQRYLQGWDDEGPAALGVEGAPCLALLPLP